MVSGSLFLVEPRSKPRQPGARVLYFTVEGCVYTHTHTHTLTHNTSGMREVSVAASGEGRF